ncbi:MAG: AAA family ATPase [Clostridiales bacterium]|nr:AAA family ATPase [Clostridiales bacterium]
MRYLSRVVIEGFQSHEKTAIEFSPTLTVLTGPSDSGKSAVLRAVRWVFQNAPAGDGFLRFGQGTCRVTLTFSDGIAVTRERGTRVNRYILSIPGADPQVFEGFGREVPEPVREILPESPYHIQGQLDAPFFLGLSPSQQAEMLGRINGMDILARAAREARRLSLRAKEEAQRQNEARDHLEKTLSAYHDLPEEAAILQKAETLLARAETLETRIQALSKLHNDSLRLKDELDRLQRDLWRLPSLEALGKARTNLMQAASILEKTQKLGELASSKRALGLRLQTLTGTLSALPDVKTLHSLHASLSSLSERLASLSGLHARMLRLKAATQDARATLSAFPPLPDLSRATDILRQLETISRLSKQAASLLRHGQTIRKELLTTEAQIQTLSQRYQELLLKAGRCPTCGQPIHAHPDTFGISLSKGTKGSDLHGSRREA